MNQLIKSILTLLLFFSLTTFESKSYSSTSSSSSCGPCCNPCDTCCDPCDSCNPCDSVCCTGYPFLAHRSQGANIARRLVGIQRDVNKCDMEDWYGAFYIAPEFTRSFRPCKITQFLFGSNNILVQGSQVDNRDSNAWLADYFGLPTDYNSVVSFCPRIQNFIVDLGMYLGLDSWYKGAFFRLYAPINYTKWELCPCESYSSTGTQTFPAGYMAKKTISRDKLSESFLKYMECGTTFGDMQSPLLYGRINSCPCSITRLADIRAELGWNFICNEEEDYHFGLAIHAAAPTGNRPCATYLFEPIAGNGKHWELGVGITSSAILWRCEECPEKTFGIYLDAAITHLFKTCQRRSFDFQGKPNSRYMLLEEMGSNINNALTGPEEDYTPADLVYKEKLIPAINITTLNVDVRIDAQADLAIKFAYMTKHWSWDIGYNLWARSGEKFCLDCCNNFNNKYSIKGDSTIYGITRPTDPTPQIVALSASQNDATINSGLNYPSKNSDTLQPRQNPRVDNSAPAYYLLGSTNAIVDVIDIVPNEQVNTSIQPKTISLSDLNICKSPSALSHKIFTHFSYSWNKKENRKCWNPYLGIGGEVEFDGKSKNYKSAINQWGIWLKGGISFE